MKRLIFIITATVMASALTPAAHGQSSSLYVQSPDTVAAPQRIAPGGMVDRLSPAVAQTSYAAVRLPEPRTFQLYDLVTIVIRESTEADSRAELETEKDAKFDGKIAEFPRLTLRDLLNFQLQGSDNDNPPQLDLSFGGKFEGEGDYRRRDTFTSRITARIIDIKPNGTLVVEARKFIKSDKESLDMVLTGTCRGEDIAADNTILSTQIYDLHLVKEHKGELRKATKKGIITKVLEAIFAF